MTARPQQDPEEWYTTAHDRVKDAYDSINNDALPDTYFTRMVLSEKYSVGRGRRTWIYTNRTLKQLIAVDAERLLRRYQQALQRMMNMVC